MRRWAWMGAMLAVLMAMPALADLSSQEAQVRRSVFLVLNQGSGGQGTGTAFAVARKGSGLWLVTCSHVVSEPGTLFLWAEDLQAPVSARVQARNPDADLALLHAEGLEGTPLTLAPPGSVRVGQSLGVIGYPRVDAFVNSGMGVTASLTRGIVSALRTWDVPTRSRVPLIQTDAGINPGNSGGPALDWETSQVLGVATATMREMQDTGLLVSVEAVRDFLASNGVRLHAGVATRTVRPPQRPRTPPGQSPPQRLGPGFPSIFVVLGLILALTVLGAGLWAVLRGGPTEPPDPGPAI